MSGLDGQQLIWLVLGTLFGAVVAVFVITSRRRTTTEAAAPPAPEHAETKPTATTTATAAAKTKAATKTKAAKKKTKATATAKTKTPATPLEVKVSKATEPAVPKLEYEDDDDVDPTKVASVDADAVNPSVRRVPAIHQPPVLPRVFDAEAGEDEPTHSTPLILTSASAQTDAGLRRKRNEDSLLVAEPHGLYVVADGMGGYSGGELASQLAVQVIGDAFEADEFAAAPHEEIPRRASELARSVQMANAAIFEKAQLDSKLEGMGTTVVAARFSVNKQRLYVAHAGDSRLYRLRGGGLEQITQDHTMSTLGVEGPQGGYLSRAVGIWPIVPVDVGLVKPMPNDLYLLCSDGLTKMVDSKQIVEVLEQGKTDLGATVERLIEVANAKGGKDNITVIVVRVDAAPVAQAS